MSSEKVPFLSVIIPVYNEGDKLLNHIQHVFDQIGYDNQVIVVDGGSEHGGEESNGLYDLKLLAESGINLDLISAQKSRALQMNAGAGIARGENLLFLHADTTLPENALKALQNFSTSKLVWGRFDVRLNNKALPYRIISWFINTRSRLTSIATGDQAIFVQRDLFENINGYSDQPLMEDIDLSIRLKQKSKPFCINTAVTTSARKWEKEGIIQTVWLMWKMRAAYSMGANPKDLIKSYYKE